MGCLVKGCGVKNPTYGYKGTNKGLCCSKHKDKLKDLVDVKNPKCAKPDCGKIMGYIV